MDATCPAPFMFDGDQCTVIIQDEQYNDDPFYMKAFTYLYNVFSGNETPMNATENVINLNDTDVVLNQSNLNIDTPMNEISNTTDMSLSETLGNFVDANYSEAGNNFLMTIGKIPNRLGELIQNEQTFEFTEEQIENTTLEINNKLLYKSYDELEVGYAMIKVGNNITKIIDFLGKNEVELPYNEAEDTETQQIILYILAGVSAVAMIIFLARRYYFFRSILISIVAASSGKLLGIAAMTGFDQTYTYAIIIFVTTLICQRRPTWLLTGGKPSKKAIESLNPNQLKAIEENATKNAENAGDISNNPSFFQQSQKFFRTLTKSLPSNFKYTRNLFIKKEFDYLSLYLI
jgi:hypothetical protein